MGEAPPRPSWNPTSPSPVPCPKPMRLAAGTHWLESPMTSAGWGVCFGLTYPMWCLQLWLTCWFDGGGEPLSAGRAHLAETRSGPTATFQWPAKVQNDWKVLKKQCQHLLSMKSSRDTGFNSCSARFPCWSESNTASSPQGAGRLRRPRPQWVPRTTGTSIRERIPCSEWMPTCSLFKMWRDRSTSSRTEQLLRKAIPFPARDTFPLCTHLAKTVASFQW